MTPWATEPPLQPFSTILDHQRSLTSVTNKHLTILSTMWIKRNTKLDEALIIIIINMLTNPRFKQLLVISKYYQPCIEQYIAIYHSNINHSQPHHKQWPCQHTSNQRRNLASWLRACCASRGWACSPRPFRSAGDEHRWWKVAAVESLCAARRLGAGNGVMVFYPLVTTSSKQLQVIWLWLIWL